MPRWRGEARALLDDASPLVRGAAVWALRGCCRRKNSPRWRQTRQARKRRGRARGMGCQFILGAVERLRQHPSRAIASRRVFVRRRRFSAPPGNRAARPRGRRCRARCRRAGPARRRISGLIASAASTSSRASAIASAHAARWPAAPEDRRAAAAVASAALRSAFHLAPVLLHGLGAGQIGIRDPHRSPTAPARPENSPPPCRHRPPASRHCRPDRTAAAARLAHARRAAQRIQPRRRFGIALQARPAPRRRNAAAGAPPPCVWSIRRRAQGAVGLRLARLRQLS